MIRQIAPAIDLRVAARIQYFMRVWIVWIINFIAYAPHDDGRMIFVAKNHILYILFCPILKIFMVTIISRFTYIPSFDPFILSYFPFIKSFVLNKKTHFIAEFIEIILVRIMAHANGIATYFFQP